MVVPDAKPVEVGVTVAVDDAGVIVRVNDGVGVGVPVFVAAGIGVWVGVSVLHCADGGFSKFLFLSATTRVSPATS